MLAKCSGTNQDGAPCSAHAWRDGQCRWHHPDLEAERRAWRTKGGTSRSNRSRARKQYASGALSPIEVEGLIGTTLRAVIAGRLEPGIGNAVANLARAAMTVRETTQLEARIVALEAAAGIGEGKTA